MLRLSDAQLMRIVREGVPNSGMPAFHALAASEIAGVVAYLRTLQGTDSAVKLPGDPARGKEVFFRTDSCSHCHAVAGSGGFIASDLSAYAHTRSPEEIRAAIINPGPTEEGQSVVVTTRDGQKYTGRIRNEDNFSLQLQTPGGDFQFLSKADIERTEPDSQAMMPSNYGAILSAKDLNDLVSFLMRSATASESMPEKETE